MMRAGKEWLGFVAAFALLAACSPPVTTDDAGDDVQGGMDGGGGDVVAPRDVRADVRDVQRPDVPPPDVVVIDPCEASRVVDLSPMMPAADGAIHVMGDNSAASMMGAIVAGCTGGGEASYQVAYRYTMRTTARLNISTANPGTAMALDTVIFAANMCARGAMVYPGSCNDDIAMGNLRSTATSTAAIPMGTQVFIIVGGYTGPGETMFQGPFELTVREVGGTPTDGGMPEGGTTDVVTTETGSGG